MCKKRCVRVGGTSVLGGAGEGAQGGLSQTPPNTFFNCGGEAAAFGGDAALWGEVGGAANPPRKPDH